MSTECCYVISFPRRPFDMRQREQFRHSVVTALYCSRSPKIHVLMCVCFTRTRVMARFLAWCAASSSLACVTCIFFLWQGRLVHMTMNTASRWLSVHSKMPHVSGCVPTSNVLSFLLYATYTSLC